MGWGPFMRRGGGRKVRAVPRKLVFLDPWGVQRVCAKKVRVHFSFPSQGGRGASANHCATMVLSSQLVTRPYSVLPTACWRVESEGFQQQVLEPRWSKEERDKACLIGLDLRARVFFK